jgi:elongation factor Ts
MAITAQMVKELREKTGVGMMDCKTALNETKGDMEAAVDWLRTKGLAKAAKKAGRVAAEGLVGVAGAGNRAAIVELNSETDFVARNDQFQGLVRSVTEAALKTDGAVESVLKAPISGGKTVESAVTDAVATIGENMTLRRSAVLSVEQGVVASYVHAAMAPGLGKIGVLVGLKSSGDQAKLTSLGRQVAMHIAAASPLAVDEKRIDPQTIARERAIFAEQAKESGKPANIIEKMVDGRMRKFFEESTLLKQAFIIDTEKTVETVLKDAANDVGGPVTVTDFVVFRLGEGVQREEQEAA